MTAETTGCGLGSTPHCESCSRLQAQNEALQKEIAAKDIEIKKLRTGVKIQCSFGHTMTLDYWGKECPVCAALAEKDNRIGEAEELSAARLQECLRLRQDLEQVRAMCAESIANRRLFNEHKRIMDAALAPEEK
jgi:hypothetical protein